MLTFGRHRPAQPGRGKPLQCRPYGGRANADPRSISLPETPAALDRSTSLTWRIAILSAGIVPSRGNAEGADAKRGQQRRSPRDPTRVKSSWNAERDQIGMEIIADSRATSPRKLHAFIESLDGKFRVECLNANWFLSLDEARRKCEGCRDYNEVRPPV
jgi:hypothetical protein